MHFGRIVTSIDHESIACSQNVPGNNDFTYDNPSIEHPTGGREILAHGSLEALGDSHNILVTKSNWKAECIAGGWLATAPDGTKYTMTEYDHFQGEPSWFTTRIEDLNGNWIRIEYDSNSFGSTYIKNIYRSDEPSAPMATYEYNNENSENITLKSITANGQVWQYEYASIPGQLFDYQQLTKVIRPDLKQWNYTYNPRVTDPDPTDGFAEDGLGSYSINKVTYPYGAQIDYTYQWIKFDQRADLITVLGDPKYEIANRRTLAIHTKTVSGVNVESGEWRYEFFPYSNFYVNSRDDPRLPLYLDVTKVTTPSAIHKYYHSGKSFAQYTSIEDLTYVAMLEVGYLGTKHGEETYTLDGTLIERKSYKWAKRLISNEKEWQGNEAFGYRRIKFSSLDLLNETVDRDLAIISSGSFYNSVDTFHYTVYSDYDQFGRARKIIEHNSTEDAEAGHFSRLTNITYALDVGNWRLSDVNTTSVHEYTRQTEFENPEALSFIDYDYDAAGNVVLVQDNGMETSYTHTEAGDVLTETDELGNTVTYTNYRRGVPQREERPEGVTIVRTINNTGTVASQQNSRGFTVHYQYDGLNRLSRIDYPINDSVVIRYQNNERILTRGTSYQRIETVDDFGQVLKTSHKDLNNPEGAYLVGASKYDALGRVVFENPAAGWQCDQYSSACNQSRFVQRYPI